MALLFDEPGYCEDDDTLAGVSSRAMCGRKIREHRDDVDFSRVNAVDFTKDSTVVFRDRNNRFHELERFSKQTRIWIVVQLVRVNCHAYRIVREPTAEIPNEEFVVAKMAMNQAQSLFLCRFRDEYCYGEIQQPAEKERLAHHFEIASWVSRRSEER